METLPTPGMVFIYYKYRVMMGQALHSSNDRILASESHSTNTYNM